MYRLLCSLLDAIWGAPISVVGVVVVDIATVVDIPSIAAVATISRAQPTVLRTLAYVLFMLTPSSV